MDAATIETLARDLVVVLSAGFVAGAICRRLGVPLLIGYLLVGAVLGAGGFRLLTQENHELEYLARGGVLLLLFAIGIEFSLGELARLSRYFFIGGSVQMLLVALAIGGLALLFLPWRGAMLLGAGAALSSTVIVFRALLEMGESRSPHGRRSIAILLFQDVALVPLMLLVPLLADVGQGVGGGHALGLLIKTAGSVALVLVVRELMQRWGVALLAWSRSRELVVVFALGLLVLFAWGAGRLGLPPALGAFAAGLSLSGNRMTAQIDALLAPYREAFSVVFFVSLGTLMQPMLLIEQPLLVAGGFVLVIVVKAAAAAAALRLTGLAWRSAWAAGVGLAQLGEFAFVVFALMHEDGLLPDETYESLLVVGLASLVATPMLIGFGRRWTERSAADDEPQALADREDVSHAIVIGAGPVGCQVASQFETYGVDVCLVDLSPVNLYPFEQQGIRTVAGDARDPAVLHRAGAPRANLAVVSVPDDSVAVEITGALRRENADCEIVVRCRYRSTVHKLEASGAARVVTEEAEAAQAILKLIEHWS